MKVHYRKKDCSTIVPGAVLTNCGLHVDTKEYSWDKKRIPDVKSSCRYCPPYELGFFALVKTTTKKSKVTCKNCLRALK